MKKAILDDISDLVNIEEEHDNSGVAALSTLDFLDTDSLEMDILDTSDVGDALDENRLGKETSDRGDKISADELEYHMIRHDSEANISVEVPDIAFSSTYLSQTAHESRQSPQSPTINICCTSKET